jgi:arylsulfatase A-like enzyme
VRARVLAALAGLFAAAGCADESAAPPGPDTRPDLLLVVVDTLRADRLSTYGNPRRTSPGLDALAATGVVFDDNTAQSSWTLPSMASMLTGRHVFVNAQRMPPDVPSLAERLADAGYETAAFVGNPAVSPAGEYDRGFEHYVGREHTGNVTWDARDLYAALNQWLIDHPRDGRPRFVYLHFMDPHFPYAPKDREVLPAEDPSVDVSRRMRLRDDVLSAWLDAVKAAGPGSPLYDGFDRDRRHIVESRDRYDREIANVDAALQSILMLLEPTERLVVVASDHGEVLWDHRHHPALVERDVPPEERTLREVFFRDHSYHLYQELIRTPLIVAGPGFPRGRRLTTPVENVDIVPTMMRAAGMPDDPALTGRALQDVVAGSARPRAAIFSFCNEGTAVRDVDDGWKLVWPSPTGDSFGMPMQLYHLATDPHERTNLAEAGDTAVKGILRRLIRQREEAAASFPLYEDASYHSDDPEQAQVLQELGYTGPR